MKKLVLSITLALAIALTIGALTARSGDVAPETKPVAGKSLWRQTKPLSRSKAPKIKSIALVPHKSASPTTTALGINTTSNCTLFVDTPVQALYDWLQGDEIYYAYQDVFFPNFNCDTTYPFVVTSIGMTLALNDTGTVSMQVFIADLDPLYSSPVCPVPGELIYVSNPYNVQIPAADVYSLAIILEEPVPVDGPYFAGVYYGNDMTAMYPGIALDTTPYLCINYNDWGEGIVDLAQNDYYNFPGSIHLFSIGYSKSGSLPSPHWIMPNDSGVVMPGNVIWVAELNDSIKYKNARFEYYKSGQWYVMGSDFDGKVALRDGVTLGGNDNGWSMVWNPIGLPEGNYLLRASISDYDSTYASDTASVYLDLKSLAPSFINRTELMSTCGPETVAVNIPDENPIAVTFGYRNLPNYEDRTLQLLNRSSYGDANGNPNDGNHNTAGEFGEYYVAPCVFASMLKYWYDKGYVEMLSDGTSFMTVPQTVEKLATLFKTRKDKGTEDDNLIYQMNNYLKSRVGRIVPEVMRQPNWSWFEANYMGRLGTVAFAIHSPFSTWLEVQKVDYQNAKADSFPVTYYDPVGGLLRDSYLLIKSDTLFLGYLPNNKRYPIDLGIALHTKLDNVTYITFGTDFDRNDGFKATLPGGQLQQNLLYLIRARAIDANNSYADGFWSMKYKCSVIYTQGDANHDNLVNVTDAAYLLAYIFAGGPAPQPAVSYGDANCDGKTNISDAVFIIQYLYRNGPPPCH